MTQVRRRWSICDTIAALQNKIKPIPQCPEMKSTIVAGPHTTNEPTIGSKEQRAVTSPHRIGDGGPSTQKPKLIRIPATRPRPDVGNDRTADASEHTLELIGLKRQERRYLKLR